MMSSLSSSSSAADRAVPVSPFAYRDMTTPGMAQAYAVTDEPMAAKDSDEKPKKPAGPTAQEIDELVRRARAEGAAEAEKRLRAEYEAKLVDESSKMKQQIKAVIDAFAVDRRGYFNRVEAEVVKLSLSIAGKILHREAHVDPMLLTALVRVAIEKVHDSSKISVRVTPGNAQQWRVALAAPVNGMIVNVVEDATLNLSDCILETDLGSANFSVEAQLKEIEQGFFDLLAQRP